MNIKKQEEETNESNNKKQFWRIESYGTGVTILLLVTLVWYGSGKWLEYKLHYNCSPEEAGQYGDMYGVINSLFSGITIAGLIYTIILQRKEITDNSQESDLQKIRFNRQRFEATFLNMVAIHMDIIKSIKLKITVDGARNTLPYVGLEGFENYVLGFEQAALPIQNQNIEEFKKKYQDFCKEYIHKLSSYIQSLVQLHQSIIEYKASKGETQARYFNLLKTYISLPERIFIFYHITLSESSGVITALKKLENDLNIVTEIPKPLINNHLQFLFNEHK